MKNNYYYSCITFFLILVLNSSLFSQQNSEISGEIINGQNLEPLAFANIAYLNTSIGTTSDENGYFILPYSKDNNEIVISYVGYKSLILNKEELKRPTNNLLALFPIEIFLQEVTVYSSQRQKTDLKEANSLSLQSEKIREISVGMPDILRSVQALPGIAVNNEFKADFNVRGGNQDENLVLVNGAQVYEPYHIKEASNASVGIFNVDLIKKVDLITGGFSARYGDKMSSVLNIKYREGNREEYTGAASISLAYVDAYFEGPISDNSSFIIGVRKSYLEYVLSMIDYEDINTAQPSFYDIQGVLSYHLSPSSKLLFEFIHAGDQFSYNPKKNNLNVPIVSTHKGESAVFQTSRIEDDDNNSSYYTNLFDLQSINILSNRSILNLELSYYRQTDDEYRLFNRITSQNIETVSTNNQFYDSLYTTRYTYDSLKIETLEFKSNLQYQFSPFYEINTGFGYQKLFYNQNADDTFTYLKHNNLDNINVVEKDTLIKKGEFADDVLVNTDSYKYNVYIENIFQFTDDFTANVGGRINYFDINKDINFSPRINISYNLGNQFILRGAWGHFYQSPSYSQLLYSQASDSNTQSQKSIHYILGLEKSSYFSDKSGSFFKFKLEGYYKDYSDVISSYFGTFERLTYSRVNDAIGSSMGLDIYLVLSIPRVYSWISYGLLFSNEDNLNDNIGEYPRYTDQRHSVSFVSNVNFGNNWETTIKAYFGSGFPYTPKKAVKNGNNEWFWESGEIHSAHLPSYKRIDFRLSKTFLFASSKLNVFLDISNIFNFKNIQNYEYETPGYSKPEVEEILLWPIIPSFGIRWQY